MRWVDGVVSVAVLPASVAALHTAQSGLPQATGKAKKKLPSTPNEFAAGLDASVGLFMRTGIGANGMTAGSGADGGATVLGGAATTGGALC